MADLDRETRRKLLPSAKLMTKAASLENLINWFSFQRTIGLSGKHIEPVPRPSVNESFSTFSLVHCLSNRLSR